MTTTEIIAKCAPQAGLNAWSAPSTFADRLLEGVTKLPKAPLMAPMAGVSDSAYRLMARAGGAELAYTEMVSVNGLHYGSDKTWKLVEPDEGEPEVAVQLFGTDPALFEEAVLAIIARLGKRLALIDVNMACPVPKVVRNGAGSALLDDPARAASIVAACARVANDAVPVTVKIRMGRRAGEDVAADFARAMARAGARGIAVHGRTATQMYAGSASWEVLRHVARAVDVPVIGTGDVRDAHAAVRMRNDTGVATVMIARGSYGNPWVFGNASRLAAGEAEVVPTVRHRLAALECHVRLLAATRAHMARGRSLCGWYLRGLPHAARWRNEAMGCVTLDDYLRLIDELRAYDGEGSPVKVDGHGRG